MKLFKGFTLAEVLITLGIIGVVSALTMPALVANYKKQEAVSKLKKSYTMTQENSSSRLKYTLQLLKR